MQGGEVANERNEVVEISRCRRCYLPTVVQVNQLPEPSHAGSASGSRKLGGLSRSARLRGKLF